MLKPKANRRRVPGKPDAGNPPVRFDEGRGDASETDNYGLFNSHTISSAHSTAKIIFRSRLLTIPPFSVYSAYSVVYPSKTVASICNNQL